jgi:predicted PurR-regulated permease PerM
MLLIAAVYLAGLVWQIVAQFADIILLFFLAWLIAFILEPLVALLQLRARLSRHLAVLAAYLVVLVAFSLAIVQLVPRLSAQAVQVAIDLPLYADWANNEILNLQAELARQGVYVSAESLLSYQEVVRHVEALGPLLLSNTVGLATGVANLLLQLFIILILSYYLTLDGHRISAALLVALPRNYRGDARFFLDSVHRSFAGFIRGQLAQAAIYGLGTAAVMTLAGLKFTLLASVTAAFFMILPFVGPFLAMVLPLFVAAVSKPEVVWVVLVSLFVVQQIVVNVVAPRLMSRTVGLHPLLIFFAMLGGAKVAGVWGAVFGIPIVGVASAMASFYRAAVEARQARGSHLPTGETGTSQNGAPPNVSVERPPMADPAATGAVAVAPGVVPASKDPSYP